MIRKYDLQGPNQSQNDDNFSDALNFSKVSEFKRLQYLTWP
jgi:hypothetical protein